MHSVTRRFTVLTRMLVLTVPAHENEPLARTQFVAENRPRVLPVRFDPVLSFITLWTDVSADSHTEQLAVDSMNLLDLP